MSADAWCAGCTNPVPATARWHFAGLDYCRTCAPTGAIGPQGRPKLPPRKKGDPPSPPWCRPCQQEATLHLTSTHLYGRDYGPVWECGGCRARVTCHPSSTAPLGRLSDARTRELRRRAHAAFDPLWQGKIRRDGCSKTKARNAAYAWLAALLGIPVEKCHISWMSTEELERTIAICRDPSRWHKPEAAPEAVPEATTTTSAAP